jgi:hypothetical protein
MNFFEIPLVKLKINSSHLDGTGRPARSIFLAKTVKSLPFTYFKHLYARILFYFITRAFPFDILRHFCINNLK